MTREQKEELVSLYVLGLLTDTEAANFELLRKDDPELAALEREFHDSTAALARSVPQVSPPSRLKSEVLSALPIETVPLSETVAPWFPWAIAACFAVLCGIAFFNVTQKKTQLALKDVQLQGMQNQIVTANTMRQQLEARIARLNDEKAALQDIVARLEEENHQANVKLAAARNQNPLTDVATVTLGANKDAAYKGREVVALWDPKRNAGMLDLSKLPAAGPGKDYQLWVVDPAQPAPVSAGVFKTADGRYFFQPDKPVGQVAALAISLEPAGGSESARGPIILIGSF